MDIDEYPSADAVGRAMKLVKGSVLAREVQRLRAVEARLSERLAARRDELTRLRAVAQRAELAKLHHCDDVAKSARWILGEEA
jgi:hypothetical protein